METVNKFVRCVLDQEEVLTRAKKYLVLPSVVPSLVKIAIVMQPATKMSRPWMAWQAVLPFWILLCWTRMLAL